jgi:hypothetical protein
VVPAGGDSVGTRDCRIAIDRRSHGVEVDVERR